MAQVVFYEKPGCINNTRQKKLLVDAGHEVDARNLLTEIWTEEKLSKYFSSLPVSQWFNQSAPDIKSGAVQPDKLSENDALTCMIANPLLIRRPLMAVANKYLAGFDSDIVDQWIGLKDKVTLISKDLEACPRTDTRCSEPDN